MKKRWRQLPDEVLFAVCDKFVSEQAGASDIARWLAERGFSCTREQVYPLLYEGIRKNYLRLCPPEEIEVAWRLARECSRYSVPPIDIKVLRTRGPTASEHVAGAAADLMLTLIKELGRRKRPVHIGLSAGQHTRAAARSLAAQLQRELPRDLPPLVLHALHSSFNVHDPTTAPLTFFAFFEPLRTPVSYSGLFAAPFVPAKDYQRAKQLPLVRDSFERAKDIDIVVMSLGQHNDSCTLFNQVLLQLAPEQRKGLERAGWIGDVQWEPYSATELIKVKGKLQLLRIFEFKELVEMAATPGKHVIMIAGPCRTCGMIRSQALLPLLKRPNLRVFNHLMTDIATAEEVLKHFD